MNKTILGILFAGSLAAPAQAQQIACDSSGHCYEFVTVPLFWEDARLEAETRTYNGMAGHLATVTSPAEHEFIVSQFPGFKGWLGGYQPFDGAVEADPAAGWQWVTGESFEYAAWASDCGQPDDYRNPAGYFPEGEEYMELWEVACWGAWRWNDAPGGFNNNYFVEYEPAQDLASSLVGVTETLESAAGRSGLVGIARNIEKKLQGGDPATALTLLQQLEKLADIQVEDPEERAQLDRLVESIRRGLL